MFNGHTHNHILYDNEYHRGYSLPYTTLFMAAHYVLCVNLKMATNEMATERLGNTNTRRAKVETIIVSFSSLRKIANITVSFFVFVSILRGISE